MTELSQEEYYNNEEDPGDYDEWIVATANSDQIIHFNTLGVGTDSDTNRYFSLDLPGRKNKVNIRAFDLSANQNILLVSVGFRGGIRTFKTPKPIAINTSLIWMRRCPHIYQMTIRVPTANTTVKLQVF